MNNIKNSFSIKDLENLSGIKAHTIRIWEKRYNLLEPERTGTNIRTYSLDNLQKLLNISYLNSNGYKISKIATLDKANISILVNEIAQQSSLQSHAINDLKLAMLNYDAALFYKTYKNLNKQKSFSDIFHQVFMPLLSDIGMLWQTNTITPTHEHFISNLIRQKILVNTELIYEVNKATSNQTFILFLPDNEIHELGLMFINYELISKGYHSIFLGQSVPIDNLKDVLQHNNDLVFISYFTIQPEIDQLSDYLKEFHTKILSKSNSKFWILGKRLEHLNHNQLPEHVIAFKSIADLVKVL
jgi:DNA-binding transcriptional MerR regulator